MGLMCHMTLGSLGFFFFLAIAKIKRGGRGKSFMGVGGFAGRGQGVV